jgi:peptidoglycan/LPS O-acetylase OafA/YrhL
MRPGGSTPTPEVVQPRSVSRKPESPFWLARQPEQGDVNKAPGVGHEASRKPTRMKQLDILRAVAVAAVLGRHVYINRIWNRMGWVGVDLFFVLSGFLISGLLFSEYKKRAKIDLARFFIRRGLKIYPAFYVLILATVLVWIHFGHRPTLGEWIPEIFFFQNYRFGMWGHTWSLAVEEHFYILLGVFLLLLSKYSRNRSDPFRVIPRTFLIVSFTLLVMRIATASASSFHYRTHLFPTHLRIDSLFFGVLLGYFHHFRPEVIPNLLKARKNRIGVAVLSVMLILPPFFLEVQNAFILTFGLTFLYLGFGGLLVLSFYCPVAWPSIFDRTVSRVGSALAYIGANSYSIYLWHRSTATWGLRSLARMLPFHLNYIAEFAAYATMSIALGILMARLIEFPVLKLRDHLYPTRSGSLA